jgi:hypothetical protein
VTVADASVGLSTGVDLICTREDGKEKRLVLVEIKAGWNRESTYDATDGNMKGCLCDLPNSARHQHAVQTVITRALFKRSYPESGSPEACVLRVTDEGVHIHPVDSNLYKRAPAIMEALSKVSEAKPKFKKARVSIKRKK